MTHVPFFHSIAPLTPASPPILRPSVAEPPPTFPVCTFPRTSACTCLALPESFSSQWLSSPTTASNLKSIEVQFESRCFLFPVSTNGGETCLDSPDHPG